MGIQRFAVDSMVAVCTIMSFRDFAGADTPAGEFSAFVW